MYTQLQLQITWQPVQRRYIKCHDSYDIIVLLFWAHHCLGSWYGSSSRKMHQWFGPHQTQLTCSLFFSPNQWSPQVQKSVRSFLRCREVDPADHVLFFAKWNLRKCQSGTLHLRIQSIGYNNWCQTMGLGKCRFSMWAGHFQIQFHIEVRNM